MSSPPLTITPPDHPLVGRVTPPGSKSITNRALLLAALVAVYDNLGKGASGAAVQNLNLMLGVEQRTSLAA